MVSIWQNESQTRHDRPGQHWWTQAKESGKGREEQAVQGSNHVFYLPHPYSY
jgi:hypothetical protein